MALNQSFWLDNFVESTLVSVESCKTWDQHLRNVFYHMTGSNFNLRRAHEELELCITSVSRSETGIHRSLAISVYEAFQAIYSGTLVKHFHYIREEVKSSMSESEASCDDKSLHTVPSYYTFINGPHPPNMDSARTEKLTCNMFMDTTIAIYKGLVCLIDHILRILNEIMRVDKVDTILFMDLSEELKTIDEIVLKNAQASTYVKNAASRTHPQPRDKSSCKWHTSQASTLIDELYKIISKLFGQILKSSVQTLQAALTPLQIPWSHRKNQE
uniref:AlNc14C99G5993 protein n=1 Tax=Albugo laibachii Nc14 TaxID=890382 RepID=F0WHC9_9STRA|nr:AlNc14C99G5993 [Albugo laibachii Nc14]|eukprot:CCA20647.1 AlNc14C99G5993 [Albugo laibachii Nc14]